VISDRVAVLERGRVAQIGTGEELFEQPRTRFVAEFVGKTNVIEGVAESADTFARGPLRVRLSGAALVPGRPVVLSVRPHQIELGAPAAGGGPAGPGPPAVLRAASLAALVAYRGRVAAAAAVLRAGAPPARRFRPGDAVTIAITGGQPLDA